MIFVSSGLGEDFNAAVAELVILRRKGILVDADFANRRLGGKLTGGKSVDIHLSAVRTRRRPGQRLQIGLKLIRIVGQCLELLAGDRDRAGVVRGVYIDGRCGIGNLNFLLLHFNGQSYVQPQRLIADHHVVVFIKRESLSSDGQGVVPR